MFAGNVITTCLSEFVPHIRHGVVLLQALAGFKRNANVELPAHIPLFGGKQEPFHSFPVVLLDALAIGIHCAKAGLRACIPIFSQRAYQFDGFCIITIVISGFRFIAWIRPGRAATQQQ